MKKIAILLPRKENYTNYYAGAASIWVKDYIINSQLKKHTIVFGEISGNQKPLTSNFINISSKGSFIGLNRNNNYLNNFYKKIINKNFSIIEIHNRPEYLHYLIKKKINSKLVFFFHNNPLDMQGSKKAEERLFLLNNTNMIYFVSNFVRNKFFEGLPFKFKNNCEVIYPSIKKLNLLPKKNNTIIFVGKLNKSKGYDLFAKAIISILNKYKSWNSIVIGNEKREVVNLEHARIKIYNYKTHKEVMNFYKKSSISITPSFWDEPFGRTAMEAASCGCATIISNKGGLLETFYCHPKLVLKKITTASIIKKIELLIKNKVFLKKIQLSNFNNPRHLLKNKIKLIDSYKNFELSKFSLNYHRPKSLKIIHLSSFGDRNNHRLFNISISTKLSKALIKNGHDVINVSYRDRLTPILKFKNKNINQSILEIHKNYKPDLLLLGHNNIIDEETASIIKKNNSTKISIWYEDALSLKGQGPDVHKNLDLVQRNINYIDSYFFTTHPDLIETKIPRKKMFYMPVPCDRDIENLKIYNYRHRFKDLFFALSHGVNSGVLKINKYDDREIFLNKLLAYSDKVNFNILGINSEEPKWNYDYYNELKKSKIALNLSRGRAIKYTSSNRIASLVANGIMTFVDSETQFGDFFSEKEMGFYKNSDDLIKQILNIKDNQKKIDSIGKRGMLRYHQIFNNNIVADYIISKTFDIKCNSKIVWK